MNIEIANRLVKLRKAHGYSQEELADKLGLSRQAVSKWERAESSPDTDNLIMLSRLYGVSLDSLLATDDDIPMPEKEEAAEEASNKNRQGVHISFSKGINVVDDDGSRVHVGWDGIRVHEGDDSEDDDDDFDPIYSSIDDIEVDDDGVSFTENGEKVHYDWNDDKDGKRRFIHKTRSEKTGKWRTIIVDEDGHRVILDTDKEIPDDKIAKNGSVTIGSHSGSFPYAVLVTGVFLLLGFLKNWWHPAWLLFLTIPIYYPVASAIRRRHFNWVDIVLPIAVTGAYVALGLTLKLWHPLWLMLLLIPLYYLASSLFKRESISTGIWAALMTLAYLAIGFAFGEKGWTVGWLLYLTVPMFTSISRSIKKRVGIRWLSRFPWELLIVAGYLFVGLMFGIWHPTWVAFILIPVLRWLISAIVNKGKGSEYDLIDDDVDIDVD